MRPGQQLWRQVCAKHVEAGLGEEGDVVPFPGGEFKVLEMEGRRIERLELMLRSEADEGRVDEEEAANEARRA